MMPAVDFQVVAACRLIAMGDSVRGQAAYCAADDLPACRLAALDGIGPRHVQNSACMSARPICLPANRFCSEPPPVSRLHAIAMLGGYGSDVCFCCGE